MPDVGQAQKTQGKLPPGMIIGPDGKPCKICTSFRNWRIPKQSASNPSASNPSASSAPSSSKNSSSDASFAAIAGTMGALAGTAVAPTPPTRPDVPPEGCPPDVEQLGRATWTFLHTTAAYYPETPSPAQRTRMLGLLFALPVLYPCSWCATHLGEEMQRHPPDVSGRAGLSRWLCMRHNEVNERLGKPVFDCSLKSTDERWKDGPSDGSCE